MNDKEIPKKNSRSYTPQNNDPTDHGKMNVEKNKDKYTSYFFQQKVIIGILIVIFMGMIFLFLTFAFCGKQPFVDSNYATYEEFSKALYEKDDKLIVPDLSGYEFDDARFQITYNRAKTQVDSYSISIQKNDKGYLLNITGSFYAEKISSTTKSIDDVDIQESSENERYSVHANLWLAPNRYSINATRNSETIIDSEDIEEMKAEVTALAELMIEVNQKRLSSVS